MRALFNGETASGLLVIAMGLFGLLAIGDLDMGVPTEMGPGYLPRLVAWAVVVGGVLMTGWGFTQAHAPLPPLSIRPVLALSAATLFFGLAVDRYGLVVAVAGMTVLASLASPITRHRETPVIAAVMSGGAVLVFVVGLKLAIPIWPR